MRIIQIHRSLNWLTCLLLIAAIVILYGCEADQPFTPPPPSSYTVVKDWPVLPDHVVMDRVTGVGVDSSNRVYAFHSGSRTANYGTDTTPISEPAVLVFDGETGILVDSWGENFFYYSHGLSVDSKGDLWLTDIAMHQVFKFSPQGELLMTIGAFGQPGEDEAHFNGPTAAEEDPDGNILVSDGYGNGRIVKFSSTGQFIQSWGQKGIGDGEFQTPHDLAVDTDHHVYVADRGNSRIQVFLTDGTFQEIYQSSELGTPWGVAVGEYNRLFVVDAGHPATNLDSPRGRVLILGHHGEILTRWGEHGTAHGQLDWAHDIDEGSDGAVYVCDAHLGIPLQKFAPIR